MMGTKVMIQLAASGLSGALALLALSLSARFFGPVIIGQAAYLIGILGLVFAFSDLGLSRAHVHFTAINGAKPDLITFLKLKLGLLFIAALMAIGIYFWRNLASVFLILLAVEIFSRLADSILISFEGQERAWPQNLLKLAVKLARLAAIIIIGLSLITVFGYGLTLLIEAGLLFLGSLFLGRSWFRSAGRPQALKQYLIYSLPFAAVVPLSYLQENGLILMLKHWQGDAALGIYTAGFGLFGFIKTFSSSLMVYFFPRISRLNQETDRAEIQNYTDLAVKLSLWVLLPIASGLFLLSPWLVPLVLGPQFTAAIGIFQCYLIGIVILSFFTPYDHVLFATNNHHSIVKINLITTLLLLFLGWQLIPAWGGLGAAWANVSVWLIGGWWQYRLLRQKTGIVSLKNWRLTKLEVKYLYGLYHSFSQAVFRFGRKKIS